MKVDDLAKAIQRELEIYSKVVKEDLANASETVAKRGVPMLKARSPRGNRVTKKYANSWKVKKVGTGWTLYNTQYQLTHLLEKGHALVDGGRTQKQVHIYPVEQILIKEFERELEGALRK